MCMCEVKGGNQYQRELAHQVVQHCVNRLMPTLRRLDITVAIRSLTDLHARYGKDLYATCEETDHREYLITVDRQLKPNTFVRYLCHEMVHVMQYATGSLQESQGAGDTVIWKGRQCAESSYSYAEQPWERQAFRWQELLADTFFWDRLVTQHDRSTLDYKRLMHKYLV